MDELSAPIVWSELKKSDRQKLRKEMLVQANNLLVEQYPDEEQRRLAARLTVDYALAREGAA